MSGNSRTKRILLASVLFAVVACVVYGMFRDEIHIRWLVSRLGKDRSYASPHMYVDRSSQELKMYGASAVPHLARAFDVETDPEIRHLIVLSLWGIEDQSAGPTLVKALSDSSPKVREEASLVVGKLKITDALPLLREMTGVEDERLRETVIWSLGEVGTREDIPLISPLSAHQNPRLSNEAHEAIQKISDRHPINPQYGRTTWFLRQAFGTPSMFGDAGWHWYNLSQLRHRSLRSGRCRKNLPLYAIDLMDADKNAMLIRFAAHAGVAESLIHDCRDARSRGESIARHLRDLAARNALTCVQTRHLLMAAFDLSIGRVQIVHMWCDGDVDDASFEESLFASGDD